MTAELTKVSLKRGFPLEMASKLWRWLNSPRGPNFDDFGPQTQAQFMMELAVRVRRERAWSIMVDGEIVGYLGFVPQNPMAGQFHGLVIAPEYRRQGIGRDAFREAMETLREEGYTSFTSMPFADNRAIHELLFSLGFLWVGELPNATKRDGQLCSLSIFHKEVR